MRDPQLKRRVLEFRKRGKTYAQIRQLVGVSLSKSTISCWCKSLRLGEKDLRRINKMILRNIARAREKALAANAAKRRKYLDTLYGQNVYLRALIKKRGCGKLALAMLYWGEGSKSRRGSLMFGNSDPAMIAVFLKLLRATYSIESKKFRCTVQCRADQDIDQLQRFWSNITRIPPGQFYKARIDPRSIGKKTEKKDYKGVCRIDYFSGYVYNDLKIAAQVIGGGL